MYTKKKKREKQKYMARLKDESKVLVRIFSLE